MIIHYF